MNKRTIDERWLSTHEASAYLGKTPKWLRENALYLEIPHLRVGRQYRFKKIDLEHVFKVSI
jgi:excisionase family DNA binding protein